MPPPLKINIYGNNVMEINEKVILLIDGDNANSFSESTYKTIYALAETYGTVYESHLFLNMKSATNPKILNIAKKYALHMHVLPIEDNAADIALTIKATEKLFTDDSYDVYIITTNDHDYMPLAIEIRQHNKKAVCFYTNKTNAKQLDAFTAKERINVTKVSADAEKTAVKAAIPKKTANVNDITRDYAASLKKQFKYNEQGVCYTANLGGRLSKAGIDYKQFEIPLKDVLATAFKKFPDTFKDCELIIEGTTGKIVKKKHK